MSVDIRETLKTQFDALNTSFLGNLQAVQSLQRTLITDILPGLAVELEWDVKETEYAREWLRDTASVFRILKRHKFTASFAFEALRMTLSWRRATLPQLSTKPSSTYLRCLPPKACDPFGRPVIVVRVGGLWENTSDLRATLTHNIELMRLHLVRLNDIHQGPYLTLQYVALLDISGITFNGVHSIELLSWFVHELIPKFPGLLAAAFVLNYSWAHAGLWNLVKRILPATALQKVFFPTESELRAYLSADAIPQDWGGNLPSVAEVENALDEYVSQALSLSPEVGRIASRAHLVMDERYRLSSTTRLSRRPERTAISATSILNPFFGYPVSYSGSLSSPLHLQHGRRRKRDLLYTLTRLWWLRWGPSLKNVMLLLSALFVVLKRRNLLVLFQRSSRNVRHAVALVS